MSKTKGNVVDPLEAIDESGADALRFALIHGAAPGNDQKFSAEKLENARNFANKLWNAARFVLGARPATIRWHGPRRLPTRRTGPAERWLRSGSPRRGRGRPGDGRVHVRRAHATLYEAIWNEYCDWALELAKVRLGDERRPAAEREATWWTLVEALDTYLRLLHPVMPFVTEAIWGRCPTAADPELLIVADWPAAGRRDARPRPTSALIDLVRGSATPARGRRRARAWLPVDVHVPSGSARRSTRSGRRWSGWPARPSDVGGPGGTRTAAAAGGLTVIAGELEAVLGRPGSTTTRPPSSARLERELARRRAACSPRRGRGWPARSSWQGPRQPSSTAHGLARRSWWTRWRGSRAPRGLRSGPPAAAPAGRRTAARGAGRATGLQRGRDLAVPRAIRRVGTITVLAGDVSPSSRRNSVSAARRPIVAGSWATTLTAGSSRSASRKSSNPTIATRCCRPSRRRARMAPMRDEVLAGEDGGRRTSGADHLQGGRLGGIAAVEAVADQLRLGGQPGTGKRVEVLPRGARGPSRS